MIDKVNNYLYIYLLCIILIMSLLTFFWLQPCRKIYDYKCDIYSNSWGIHKNMITASWEICVNLIIPMWITELCIIDLIVCIVILTSQFHHQIEWKMYGKIAMQLLFVSVLFIINNVLFIVLKIMRRLVNFIIAIYDHDLFCW